MPNSSILATMLHLFSLIFLTLTCTAMTVMAQVYNKECNFGSMAMTDELGKTIPQTCFQLNGRNRCFYTFVPDCVRKSSSPVALVYDIHDQGDCPVEFAKRSGWFEKASQECFVVVWPTGNNQKSISDFPCWQVPGGLIFSEDEETQSCCCRKHGQFLVPEDTNDVNFLRQSVVRVIHDLKVNDGVSIDSKKIYMTGHGNGCTMAMTMAALSSDMIAAVCCMAGSFLTLPSPNYMPTPIWNCLGEEDTITPYEGFFQPDFGLVTPDAQDAFQALSEWNGCLLPEESPPVVEYIPSMNLDIGNNIIQKATLRTDRALHCQNDATVELVTVSTAGHNLYYNDLNKLIVDEKSHIDFPSFSAKSKVDTTSMAWHFCKAHSRIQAPLLDTISNAAGTNETTTKKSEIISSSGEREFFITTLSIVLLTIFCCDYLF